MYNSRKHSAISYCIRVWDGVSQCTSRCNDFNRIHKRIVKDLFSKFFFFKLVVVSSKKREYKK